MFHPPVWMAFCACFSCDAGGFHLVFRFLFLFLYVSQRLAYSALFFFLFFLDSFGNISNINKYTLMHPVECLALSSHTRTARDASQWLTQSQMMWAPMKQRPSIGYRRSSHCLAASFFSRCWRPAIHHRSHSYWWSRRACLAFPRLVSFYPYSLRTQMMQNRSVCKRCEEKE